MKKEYIFDTYFISIKKNLTKQTEVFALHAADKRPAEIRVTILPPETTPLFSQSIKAVWRHLCKKTANLGLVDW